MNIPGDYADTKFCPTCDKEVRYLSTPEHCYCVECGARVRLFKEKPVGPTHWARRRAATSDE